MLKLILLKNIFREILETPKKSLFYRLYYELAKKLGWFYLRFLITNHSKIKLAKIINFKNNDLLNYFRQKSQPKFFIDYHEKDRYQTLWLNNFSKEKENLIGLADKICQHQIDIFNLESFDFGKQINWHLDPQSQKEWSKKHWSLININNPKMGDIKYCWQLNRHQHFYILGRAYWITGDEKYAQEFIFQATDWIKNNPPEIGVNWLSSLEIAVRLISWTWAFYFFIGSHYFTPNFLKNYLKSIYLMTRHIEKNINLAKYCIHNDHFIGEAFALFFVGTVFPEFKKSKKWQKIGWEILNQEIIKQVYNDGVFFMYSPYYQRQVMEFYILFFRLADLNQIKLPLETREKFKKMLQFIVSLINKNGQIPSLGENDGSKVFRLGNKEFDDFRPLLEAGSMAISGKPFHLIDLDEETFWLFGQDYLEKKQKNEFYSLEKKRKFPLGGYYILESSECRLIFHCGENKSGYGHADMLHFTLEINDKLLLLDSGTYLYNTEKKWRDYFKGTKSHNTVVIDDQDQMINWRKFKWLKLTRGKLKKFKKDNDSIYIEGEHYGYTSFKNPVIHNRSIHLHQNKIMITDKFTGYGDHQLDFYFHLPKCEYRLNQKTKEFIAKIKGETIKFSPQSSENFEVDVQVGSESPIQGWYSPSYGTKIPCLSLKYSLRAKLPYQFINILSFE